jgi:hypothetical protein
MRIKQKGYGASMSACYQNWPTPAVVPATVEQLATWKLPDGRSLPASLRTFLTFDTSWLFWFQDVETIHELQELPWLLFPGAFAQSVTSIQEQEWQEHLAWQQYENEAAQANGSPLPYPEYHPEACPPPYKNLVSMPGAAERWPLFLQTTICLVLPSPTLQRYLLLCGKADELGEFPVVMIGHKTNEVTIAWPGFDVYLQSMFGHSELDTQQRSYQEALRWHQEHNFGEACLVMDDGSVFHREPNEETFGPTQAIEPSQEVSAAEVDVDDIPF